MPETRLKISKSLRELLERFRINKEWKAIAILAGTTIGAGMFGLPYVFSRLGYIPALIYMLVLGGVVLFFNLLYGEVILRTPGDHQINGYLKVYLGEKMFSLKFLNTFSFFVSAYGGLLAYSIKIGEFIQMILGFGNPVIYTFLFYALACVALYLGLRSVSTTEAVVVGLIMLSTLLLVVGGANKIEWQYLKGFNPAYLLLPYGVILFALNGSSVIPEMEEILRDRPSKLRKSIILGTIAPIIVYILFTFLVVGDSGPFTSQDALSGMVPILPVWMVKMAALVGILAMASSFLSLGLVLKESWFRDFKFSKGTSFLLSIVPPLFLFIFGVRGFIRILEFSGAISVGLTSFLILMMHKRAQRDGKREPAYSFKVLTPVYVALQVLLIIGVLAPFFSRLI